MNSFDLVVALLTVFAIGIGFRAGLLRSVMTILGYLLAMPIAVLVSGWIAPRLGSGDSPPLVQNSMLFFLIFLGAGIGLGALLRALVDDLIGSRIGLADRLAGAALGAVRILLIAITMVLIFDELIPANLQPDYLTGSKLRPLLASAGQRGFRSLPPEVAAYIDQLKKIRRI